MTHEAFIYESDEEYEAVLVPFLRDAVAAGEPAVAITRPERIELLRERLGAAADAVAFFDADAWYTRPGAAGAAWHRALAEPGHLHGIGELPLAGDSVLQTLWLRYESLLNRACASGSARIVCPYDARRVSGDVLDVVRRTHPILLSASGREPSPQHYGAPELLAPLAPLGDLTHAKELTVLADVREPATIRRRLTWRALEAGLPRAAAEDLIAVVTALAVEAGSGTSIRTLASGKEWICELSTIADAAASLESSEPFLVGRLVSDRVELGAAGDRFVTRFVFGPATDPRRRILAAATALFPEHGVRGTGVNTIIARAGVAKATFYACFPSKRELVREWMRSPEARRFRDVWAEVEERTEHPADRLVEFFAVLGGWVVDNDFRWPMITVHELEEGDHETRAELAAAADEPEQEFRSAAAAAGLASPEALAQQFDVLRLGAITAAVMNRSTRPLESAAAAARALVAAARP